MPLPGRSRRWRDDAPISHSRQEKQRPGTKNARAVVIVTVLQPIRRLLHVGGHAIDIDDVREPDIRVLKAA